MRGSSFISKYQHSMILKKIENKALNKEARYM